MVAAPETQTQSQEVPAQGQSTIEAIKQSNSGKESSNEGQQPVNGFTVVDESSSSTPANGASEGSPAHNLPPPDVARNIPCRFFPLGTCKYGEQCIFSHGIPGVAGSPGVPASPSVQPQVAPGQTPAEAQQPASSLGRQPQPQQAFPHLHPQHHHQQQQQQQQQHMMEQQHSMEHAYMQGMPLYYPEQGIQYGFQPPFSPEQGYYHFAPPPFQNYPQHYQQFAPHAYYGHPHPPPPPPPPAAPAGPLPVSVHSSRPSSTVETPVTSSPVPSPSQPLESATAAPQPVASAEQASADATSPASIAPSSLHTFFQTASSLSPAAAPTVPVSTTSPLSQASAPLPPVASTVSPSGFVKPLPGRLAGPRRSIGGMAPNGFVPGPNAVGGGLGGKPRRSFGGSRPPCSFFEANRCKNGDECSFVHLLPDGSDARALGRGMIGSDGRTDSPEATGGTPPAWLINQKALRFSGGNVSNLKKHAEGGIPAINGAGGPPGAYPYRERNGAMPHQGRRVRYDEEQQHARYANGSTASAPQVPEGQAPFQPSLLPQPNQNGAPRPVVDGSLTGRIPPGGAGTPQLVAAINGLTRRIPPAHLPPSNGAQHERSSDGPVLPSANSHVATAPRSREPSQQRVPTVNDFPALGSPAAPLSPAVEKESFTNAVESTPVPPQPVDTVPAAKESEDSVQKEAVSSPSAETEGFVMVSHDDAKPSPAPTSPSVNAQPVDVEAAPSAASTAAARPAPPPKFTMSFASIAKAASSAAAPTPEKKTAKAAPSGANKPAPEVKPSVESIKPSGDAKNVITDGGEDVEKETDDGFITKTSKKSKKTSAANKLR